MIIRPASLDALPSISPPSNALHPRSDKPVDEDEMPAKWVGTQQHLLGYGLAWVDQKF